MSEIKILSSRHLSYQRFDWSYGFFTCGELSFVYALQLLKAIKSLVKQRVNYFVLTCLQTLRGRVNPALVYFNKFECVCGVTLSVYPHRAS